MTRIVRLAFLSPDLVEAILAGKQDALVDGKGLAEGSVAIDWKMQVAATCLLQHTVDRGRRREPSTIVYVQFS